MVFGMDVMTAIHVALSLVGIASGVLVLAALVAGRMSSATSTFIVTTVLTSATGFLLPADRLLPSHVFGILSLLVLAVAVHALYVVNLAGASRWIYVISASVALYLNVFVLIAQLFAKIPSLHALAPTPADLPFLAAQGATFAAFAVLTLRAVRRF